MIYLTLTVLKEIRGRSKTSLPSPLPSTQTDDLPSDFANEPIAAWLEENASVVVTQGEHEYVCSYRRVSHANLHQIFHEMSAVEIAQCLSKQLHSIYATIHARELVIWGRSKSKERDCPRFFTLVKCFNRLSAFFSSLIVTKMYLKERLEIIHKILDICQSLLTHHNYLAFQAVLSSLNHSSVERMKRTWASLEHTRSKDLESYREIMSQFGNFSTYRGLVALANAPFLPYPGCTTKDLLFLNDGNPDYINKEVNVAKMLKISECVYEFKRGQSEVYVFAELRWDESVWDMSEYLPMSEAELDRWSRLSEPLDYEKKLVEMYEQHALLQDELKAVKEQCELQVEEVKRKCEKEVEMMKQNYEDQIQKLREAAGGV
jgi:hypothetical protein